LAKHFPKFPAIAGTEFSRSYSPTQHLYENLKFRILEVDPLLVLKTARKTRLSSIY